MELFPIFEDNSKISPNIWYSLNGTGGENPFMRVGHTIVHDQATSSKRGKLFVIGGANPCGSFNDVYVFDLDTFAWDKHEDFDNFESGRYEHACFFNESTRKIYIFGGSNETQSFNDMLEYTIDENTFRKVESQSANVPSARTIHVGATFKNQLVVFGGGLMGKTAVNDSKVYVYNPVNNKWASLTIQADSKSPDVRHGHLMVSFNDEMIYLHGGMREEKVYDDLWCLDMKHLAWKQIEPSSNNLPAARAAHGGICINTNLYIYGGLSENKSALDDLWKYDANVNQWSMVELFGDRPPRRLDFAYCKMMLKSKNTSTESTAGENDTQKNDIASSGNDVVTNFLVIQGGMDTEGYIFDDLFIINLE